MLKNHPIFRIIREAFDEVQPDMPANVKVAKYIVASLFAVLISVFTLVIGGLAFGIGLAISSIFTTNLAIQIPVGLLIDVAIFIILWAADTSDRYDRERCGWR